jgi:cytidyltransferase-like protein
MTTVFVSGCYDVLHGGHVEFFRQARALGDHLTVCFAGDRVMEQHKHRPPSMPEAHKQALLEALKPVDAVVRGEGDEPGLDFRDHFLRLRPDILAVTEDDRYADEKRALCAQVGAKYVVLPKTLPIQPVSTTDILRRIRVPLAVPLRVDIAGGWLDVPRLARPGAFVVNCAIAPLVSLTEWPYHIGAGLGGSGARAMLEGRDPVGSELDLGVGWQDPAVIRETGLCVWRSGARPVLELKTNPDWLNGTMALLWTGKAHLTPSLVEQKRDYDRIEKAGAVAMRAARDASRALLAEALKMSCAVQYYEGMDALPAHGELAKKYCGGGWGGYALYLFADRAGRDRFAGTVEGGRPIEPYMA